MPRHLLLVLILLVSQFSSRIAAVSEHCPHEAIGLEQPDNDALNYTVLLEGRPIMTTLSLNRSKLYHYETYNVTVMNQPERYRKLIISLEPCEGIVYVLIRKTRPCWPDPHSCCKPLSSQSTASIPTAPPCGNNQRTQCSWTHYNSILDGTKDGAPTFFEVPLASTKYYITVYAPQEANIAAGVLKPRYRLTLLADIGAYPRPGLQGRLNTKQVGEMSVELQWQQATFTPEGVSELKNYYIYSSLLLPAEEKTNDVVFLKPSKIMNSVCGLENNAVKYGNPLTNVQCLHGACSAIVHGVLPKKKYMFNVVAESMRGFNSSYSGIVVSSDWKDTTKLFGDNADTVIAIVGSVCGTVFGVVIMGYLWFVKLYN